MFREIMYTISLALIVSINTAKFDFVFYHEIFSRNMNGKIPMKNIIIKVMR